MWQHYMNDWHDYVRLVVMCAAIVCLILLGRRYSKGGGDYNTKTKDLWFVLVLWCCTAVVLPLEGISEDRGLEPRLIFYSFATLLTLKALLKRGNWGVHD